MAYDPVCVNCGWRQFLHEKHTPFRKEENPARSLTGYPDSLKKCRGFEPKENQRKNFIFSLNYPERNRRTKNPLTGGELLSYLH
jgi:hypothetical protein